MGHDAVANALEDTLILLGRPGLCVFSAESVGDKFTDLVPHGMVCLTTPDLVEEAGFELEHTRDGGEERHYTIWAPPEVAMLHEDGSTLVGQFQPIFRGPVPKGEVDHEWRTDDLRGLQSPGP